MKTLFKAILVSIVVTAIVAAVATGYSIYQPRDRLEVAFKYPLNNNDNSLTGNTNSGSPPSVSTVIIPDGAALQSSPHNNFEPSTIKVVIGYNNTVRWINKDSAYSSVIAADDTDPSFFNATQDNNGNPTEQSVLAPNESFEFTFTRAGEYHYYSAPHPWMQGTVIVVNE